MHGAPSPAPPSKVTRTTPVMPFAVAVSGGTDSLLALLLLKEEGAHPAAVHADFLGRGRAASAELEGLLATLDIPFHWIDLSEEFRRLVIEPFIEGYLQGQTPNPCAHCNRLVKFGLLHDWAERTGFAGMATGHYARILDHPTGPALFRGLDPTKDQSYFLSLVHRKRLRSVRFPLGRLRKRDVRDALDRRGIKPPLPSESQEVCFVPGGDYRRFLHACCAELPGPGAVEDIGGVVLGRHHGLWRHTLGQRRGLGIAHSEPLYVLHKDRDRNVLVVGTRDELLTSSCTAGSANYLLPPSMWPGRLLVQTVYRQRAVPADVRTSGLRMSISFAEPQPRPCPGQIAAVYSSEGQVLAGGIITPAGADS
jgi:tRNA-uridine 2-sulfurtransferase